jgi:uncharacterized protein
LCVTDICEHDHGDRKAAADRENRLPRAKSKLGFKCMPGSVFAPVETLGFGYAIKLIGRSLVFRQKTPASPEREGLKDGVRRCRSEQTLKPQTNLAGKTLKAMGLTAGFSRLVMLAGHESASANNPHAAGRDCGACAVRPGQSTARSRSSPRSIQL